MAFPEESALWTDDADGDPVIPRAVEATRHTVEVTGAIEALVVGPDDVLVISFPDGTFPDELEHVRDHFDVAGLKGRILLIAGAEQMAKIQRDHGRRYPRPGQRVEADVAFETRMGD